MKYLIDSANLSEIEEAVSFGVCGITANPSMYAANNQAFFPFLRACLRWELPFLSGEVMGGTLPEMLNEAEKILSISPGIVIKINFSREGLTLCRILKKQGVRCAVTLIFTMEQALLALGAGADFLFPFVGRTDEYGGDGLALVTSLQHMILQKKYSVKVIAASVKNLRQLQCLAAAGVDYAAVSYSLLEKSMEHPLTESGRKAFLADWERVSME